MPSYSARGRIFALVLISSNMLGCSNYPFKEPIPKSKTPEERVHDAEKAFDEQPKESTSLRADVLQERERAVQSLLAEAAKAESAGKWEEAVLLYQRVLSVDDHNQRALAKLKDIDAGRRYSRLIADARQMLDTGDVEGAQNKVRQVLLAAPLHTEARELQTLINSKKLTPSIIKLPQLKASGAKSITLEFREANLKMIFEGLSRTSGVNFVLDKDIKPDTKATVFVKQVSLDAAITAILDTNQLQKKVVDETTVLVYPNTPQKNAEYRDLVIKSFYLANADIKQVANLLKTTLKIKDMHLDERLNLVVLRETPEVIRLAEKLIALQDVAEPEVMLEVEILEISRSKLTELGIKYPTSLTAGNVTSAATGTSAFSALTLEALKNLNSSGITVSPNPAINLKKTEGIVNLLANPRIRVKTHEKAKVQIGDRVPVITANVSPTAATVSDSVQYIDVGLKLEVEPVVSIDNHVSIKVGLEVGTIGAQTTTKNGSVVYQIGTRSASTLLRLNDGETQVLAGLISDDDRRNVNKLPGLGDIPLLGRLFSNNAKDQTKTEIVLAITPRIVNNLQQPEPGVMEMWSGTDNNVTDVTPVMSASKQTEEPVKAALKPAEPADVELPVVPVAQPEPVKSRPYNPSVVTKPLSGAPAE